MVVSINRHRDRIYRNIQEMGLWNACFLKWRMTLFDRINQGRMTRTIREVPFPSWGPDYVMERAERLRACVHAFIALCWLTVNLM